MLPVTQIVGSRDILGVWRVLPLAGKERKVRREGVIASSQQVFVRLRPDSEIRAQRATLARRGSRHRVNALYLDQLAATGECTIDLEVSYEPAALPIPKHRVVLRSITLRPGEVQQVSTVDGIYLLDPHKTGDLLEEVDPEEGRLVMARRLVEDSAKRKQAPVQVSAEPAPDLALQAVVLQLQAELAELRAANAAAQDKPKRARPPRPKKSKEA